MAPAWDAKDLASTAKGIAQKGGRSMQIVPNKQGRPARCGHWHTDASTSSQDDSTQFNWKRTRPIIAPPAWFSASPVVDFTAENSLVSGHSPHESKADTHSDAGMPNSVAQRVAEEDLADSKQLFPLRVKTRNFEPLRQEPEAFRAWDDRACRETEDRGSFFSAATRDRERFAEGFALPSWPLR